MRWDLQADALAPWLLCPGFPAHWLWVAEHGCLHPPPVRPGEEQDSAMGRGVSLDLQGWLFLTFP